MALDGTYGIVYAGHEGVGIGVLSIAGGKVIGADGAGATYEGTATEDPQGVHLEIRMQVPAGVWLVQGTSEQAEPYTRVMSLDMPPNFGGGRPFEVLMPPGPVTAIVKRVPDEWARYARGITVAPKF